MILATTRRHGYAFLGVLVNEYGDAVWECLHMHKDQTASHFYKNREYTRGRSFSDSALACAIDAKIEREDWEWNGVDINSHASLRHTNVGPLISLDIRK